MLPGLGKLLGRRWREETDEGVGLVERLLVDFRLGHRVDPCGDRLPTDRLFRRDRRARDSLLGGVGPAVELDERGDERLSAEASDPPVEEAIGAPGNSIVISIIGIRIRQDGRLRDRVQEAKAEDIGRRSMRDRGRLDGLRLAVDPEGRVKSRSHLLLDHESALVDQGIAEPGRRQKRAHVHLDLVAASPDGGILVALGAGVRVEDRAQARLRREYRGEPSLAAVEERSFLGGQPDERLTRLGRLGAPRAEDHRTQGQRDERRRRAAHRAPPPSGNGTVSIAVAISRAGAFGAAGTGWYRTRTIVPGLSLLRSASDPPTLISQSGATFIRYKRSA